MLASPDSISRNSANELHPFVSAHQFGMPNSYTMLPLSRSVCSSINTRDGSPCAAPCTAVRHFAPEASGHTHTFGTVAFGTEQSAQHGSTVRVACSVGVTHT